MENLTPMKNVRPRNRRARWP